MGEVLTSLPFWLGLAAVACVVGWLQLVGGGLLKAVYWFRLVFGTRIFGRANWAGWRDLRKAEMDRAGGLRLGTLKRRPIFQNGEGHLITIAGTGGGKSSGLVVPALCDLTEGSVVVTDPSGELAAMTARRRAEIGPVVFLNPFSTVFEADTGLTFPDHGLNLLAHLDPKSPNFQSDVDAVARYLFVTDRRDSGSYWNEEGAAFLSLLIAATLLYEPAKHHELTFIYEMSRDTAKGFEDYLWYLAGKPKPTIAADARRFHAMLTNAPQQWAGMISKTQLALKRYAPDQPLGVHVSKNGFDVRRLKREKVTVYLLVPTSMLPVAMPWLNAVIGLFGAAVAQPGPRSPVTLLLDEMPALGYLPDLRSTMAQNRKAGLRAWIFSQTYAALASPDMYGAEGVKELMGLCTVKQFFALEEPEMWELVSKMAGQRSVSNPSSSGQMGDVGQPLIRPDEVRGLTNGRQIIFRGTMTSPIKAKLVRYFDDPRLSLMVDPNPYRR